MNSTNCVLDAVIFGQNSYSTQTLDEVSFDELYIAHRLGRSIRTPIVQVYTECAEDESILELHAPPKLIMYFFCPVFNYRACIASVACNCLEILTKILFLYSVFPNANVIKMYFKSTCTSS